jgi:hypothetical protein
VHRTARHSTTSGASRQAREERQMFDPHCDTCQQRVLLGTKRLEGMANTPEGIFMVFRCTCGGIASMLTGESVRRPTPA